MYAGLLTLALVVTPAAPPVPTGLQAGDEFTFVGTVAEAVERPGERFRRNHDLTLRVLVLDHTEKWVDTAVITCLKRTDDAVTGAAGAVTGTAPKDAPPLVHVDLVRVHADGTAHLLVPTVGTPLKLDAGTPARALPPVPVNAFAPSEFGVFPPREPRNNNGKPWTVAAGPTRPNETWWVKDIQFLTAERCEYLVMNQQSADWLAPVGGVAWHRAEAVWVSTRDGTARKVHRVIKQREGRADAPPCAWVETQYELHERATLDGRTFARARRDVEVAYATLAEIPTLLGPKQIEARLVKLDAHLATSDPAGAYREALDAAKRALEAANRGEAAPVAPPPTPPPASVALATRPPWPEPGQPAADVRFGTARLSNYRGKPVVLVFLKPGGETTDLALAVADALEKRYAGKVAVVPLVVFGELAAAAKDRDRLKLTVGLHDGTPAAMAYGVNTVPRFAVIDATGTVRWTFTGIGTETGFLVREQVDRMVRPVSPVVPAGTTPAPELTRLPPIPPP